MANITRRVIRNARRRGATVLSRPQWGNVSPVYQWRRINRRHALLPRQPVDTLWQHITVTHRQGLKADMRTLHRIGMERFGSGVSYNFAVDMRTGHIALGQNLDAKGTHTLNDKDVPGYSYDQNAVSLAVVAIGMPGDELSDKAADAIATLIAALVDEGALTRGHDYNPHSLVAWKDCPCDPTRNRMAEIQRKANRLLARH